MLMTQKCWMLRQCLNFKLIPSMPELATNCLRLFVTTSCMVEGLRDNWPDYFKLGWAIQVFLQCKDF